MPGTKGPAGRARRVPPPRSCGRPGRESAALGDPAWSSRTVAAGLLLRCLRPASAGPLACGLLTDPRRPARLAREVPRRSPASARGSPRCGHPALHPPPTEPTATAAARRSSHWATRPAAGTSPPPRAWPASPSRIRRLARNRLALPSEPGCGFFRISRSSRSCRFSRRSRRSSSRSSVVRPSSRRPSSRSAWGDAVADRLRRRLKLAGQLFGISSRPHQLNHLPPELGRVRRSVSLGHRGPLSAQSWGVHETGATSRAKFGYRSGLGVWKGGGAGHWLSSQRTGGCIDSRRAWHRWLCASFRLGRGAGRCWSRRSSALPTTCYSTSRARRSTAVRATPSSPGSRRGAEPPHRNASWARAWTAVELVRIEPARHPPLEGSSGATFTPGWSGRRHP